VRTGCARTDRRTPPPCSRRQALLTLAPDHLHDLPWQAVTRVQAIIAERRGITGDTALRLARYFGTTPEFWLNAERDYELETAAEALGSRRATRK
jgi:hypothetical protein